MTLLRALTGSQPGPRQPGQPPTYTSHQFAHAQRQLRRGELARARNQVPRLLGAAMLGGAAVAASTTIALGLAATVTLAAGLIGLTFFPGHQHRQPWDEWQQTRRHLTGRLQQLGSDWTVLWDRRLNAAPTPVTVALGHSGLWLLWAPEPEWATPDATPTLELALQEIVVNTPHPAIAVHAAAIHNPANVDHVLNLMTAGVPQAGPDQLDEWAHHLHLTTLQEPLVVPK